MNAGVQFMSVHYLTLIFVLIALILNRVDIFAMLPQAQLNMISMERAVAVAMTEKVVRMLIVSTKSSLHVLRMPLHVKFTIPFLAM